MPATIRLPKGCPSSRGTSDIRHTTALGGQRAHVANRLYMLTVRRESLVNKRRSLQHRMSEIDQQIKQMEADIRATEGKYGSLKGTGLRGGKRCRKNIPEKGNGRAAKTVAIKF